MAAGSQFGGTISGRIVWRDGACMACGSPWCRAGTTPRSRPLETEEEPPQGSLQNRGAKPAEEEERERDE